GHNSITAPKKAPIPPHLRFDVSSGVYRLRTITEENRAIAKAAFLQKLELQPDVLRQGRFAASHNNRDQEQVALVHQPRPEGLGGEFGAPNRDILLAGLFQLANGFRVELSLDSRLAGGD